VYVLLIIDHAPDYREAFFRELGRIVALTVVAQPCEPDGLASPDERKGYTYLEIPSFKFMGFFWQPGLRGLVRNKTWDIVCVGINVRQLCRIFAFISLPEFHSRWVWRGHIFGKTKSKLLDYFRGLLLGRAAACLAYSEAQSIRVKHLFGIEAVSFNNTEVKANEFRTGHFPKRTGVDAGDLRLLFVGRDQPRKKLERLITLAARRQDISVRLVGPGMEARDVPANLINSRRIEIFGKTSGEDLNPHFDWADLVVSPGHVGLLVMNAARHGKGIAIDANSHHAPEYWLAKEAGQPFVAFGDSAQEDQFFENIFANRRILQNWGEELQRVAKSKYTIEYMSAIHAQVFRAVINKNAPA